MKKMFILTISILLFLMSVQFVMAESGNNEPESECTTSADCDSDEFCDNGECEDLEENETECSVNSDCDSDKICLNGECEDKEDEQEDNFSEDDREDTGKEAKIMFYEKGAEIRLIQLQRAINKAVIKGNIVIDYLDNRTNNSNTTRLEEILDELEAIDAEIQEYRNTSVYNRTSVQKFVEWKKDSLSLVKEFRQIARGLLTEEDASALKELFRNADYSDLDSLKEEIRTVAHEYNGRRAKDLLDKFGIDKKDLVEKLEKGELDIKEARERLRNEFSSINKEKRTEILKKISEERIKAEERRMEAIKIFSEDSEKARKARMEKREKIEQRIKDGVIEKRVKTRIENRQERRGRG